MGVRPTAQATRRATSAHRRVGVAASALVVVAAVGLAACSTGAGSPSESSAGTTPAPDDVASASASVDAEHSDADTAFAQQMIVHHEGAVEMAQLAQERSDDPAVLDLAQRIEGAQAPEIALMSGWLQAWDEPVEGDHGGHGGMEGMAESDLAALEDAEGAAFDRLFLQQMTVHHEDAVEMARTEQTEGSNRQAVQLAAQIETAQSAEVQEMDQLLGRLAG